MEYFKDVPHLILVDTDAVIGYGNIVRTVSLSKRDVNLRGYAFRHKFYRITDNVGKELSHL